MAVVAAAIVVVVLVGLIAGGILVLPAHTTSPVTISYVDLEIKQGNTSAGVPWLGRGFINYTEAEGFPLQVAPGGTFSIVWENIINLDDVPHTIYKVTPNPPFTIASTVPPLPDTIAVAGEGNLGIYVGVPSTPGATYAVTLVVDAQNPS